VQQPRPLKQEIERCDAPAAARRFITAAPRLELGDLGRANTRSSVAFRVLWTS
jgi:hypothetical protein